MVPSARSLPQHRYCYGVQNKQCSGLHRLEETCDSPHAYPSQALLSMCELFVVRSWCSCAAHASCSLWGCVYLRLQAINLRTRYGTSGLQLLMRSGPHWLQLEQPALPLTFYNSSATASAGSCSSSGSAMDVVPNSRVPPVQVSRCCSSLALSRHGF